MFLHTFKHTHLSKEKYEVYWYSNENLRRTSQQEGEKESKIVMYGLCGIKAWPYFRQLKKPKRMKLPEPIEEKPEEDIIIDKEENVYALSTESV